MLKFTSSKHWVLRTVRQSCDRQRESVRSLVVLVRIHRCADADVKNTPCARQIVKSGRLTGAGGSGIPGAAAPTVSSPSVPPHPLRLRNSSSRSAARPVNHSWLIYPDPWLATLAHQRYTHTRLAQQAKQHPKEDLDWSLLLAFSILTFFARFRLSTPNLDT